MEGDELGRLEAECKNRRKRILGLKNQFNANGESRNEENAVDERLVFRSYEPLNANNTDDIHLETADKPRQNSTSAIDSTTGAYMINLAPRKVDWDLKRDTDAKMQILERMTQKTVVKFIRERMKTNVDTK